MPGDRLGGRLPPSFFSPLCLSRGTVCLVESGTIRTELGLMKRKKKKVQHRNLVEGCLSSSFGCSANRTCDTKERYMRGVARPYHRKRTRERGGRDRASQTPASRRAAPTVAWPSRTRWTAQPPHRPPVQRRQPPPEAQRPPREPAPRPAVAAEPGHRHLPPPHALPWQRRPRRAARGDVAAGHHLPQGPLMSSDPHTRPRLTCYLLVLGI